MKSLLTLPAILIIFNFKNTYAQQCKDMIMTVNAAPDGQYFKFRNQISLDDKKWQLAITLDAVTLNKSISIFLMLNAQEFCVEKGDSIDFTFSNEHTLYLKNDLDANCDKKLAIILDGESENNQILDSLLSKDLTSITVHHKGIRIKGNFKNDSRSLFRAGLRCLHDVLMSEAAAIALKEAESNVASTVIEIPPQFPGGWGELMQFMKKNLKRQRIEGTVLTTFIIEKDGSLSEPKVLKSLSPKADAEALRLINLMPKWIPGIQDRKPVRVRFNLPVQFK
jgi:periplasmic protein TonB